MNAHLILFIGFAMTVLGIPLYGVIAEMRAERARVAAWERAAARTGLKLTIHGAALALAGIWRGLDVEVRQYMVPRYKAAPLIVVSARARLPVDTPADAGAAQARALEQTVVTDGWLEWGQQSRLDPDRLEALLDALSQSACHAAAEHRGA